MTIKHKVERNIHNYFLSKCRIVIPLKNAFVKVPVSAMSFSIVFTWVLLHNEPKSCISVSESTNGLLLLNYSIFTVIQPIPLQSVNKGKLQIIFILK
ncbi:hypothetical protein GDO86_006521 [Hymenochirus boettgeri]|uniref:Uncharacterized protein n=1 Tax=Hymenochirus boettgeri TaxID=247094 RepID=A0A8T2J8Y7_9PIPI|nr:hypothetical protein GDO86_006521 [Hymenochirus boettgeri]